MRASLILLAALLPYAALAKPTLSLAEFQSTGPEPAPLLILGTFHFKDAGLDSYKPETDVDIFSAKRQRELEEVIEQLAAFGPKKIALEARADAAERLQKEYRLYLDDAFEPGANEIYQLGFRLGRTLGHEMLYFVDAAGRPYEQGEPKAAPECDDEAGRDLWNARYFALYRHDDRAKANATLRETFLYMNSEARLLAGHGHYLVGDFHRGCGDEYHGADSVTGWWYNRNLRIFANLGRIREPGERMLLIIGAGHVPIIRHAASASPEFKVIELRDVLEIR